MTAMTTMQLVLLDSAGSLSRNIALSEKAIGIGRHPDNDVHIDDELASRFHCTVEPDGQGAWRVRDLGSRNGTRVNDQRVTDSALNAGDRIRVGRHVFVVEGVSTEQATERRARRDRNVNEETGSTEAPTRRREAKQQPSRSAPSWLSELRQMTSALTAGSGEGETVSVIDARGRRSEALAGAGEGAVAMRLLLLTAAKARATDIHVEPKGETVQVRLRVDGTMIGLVDLPSGVGELVIGLVKAACHMKTAGRDAVLDGHFSSMVGERRLDMRASLTPSVHGQKLVLRILNCADAPERLAELGIPSYMYDRLKKVVEKESGLLLVSGHTGSGKTTTLYNAMREIDRERRNVITIEDPVEHHLDHITQIPVNSDQGATFGQLLRSVLRQDPDVILVGEIRDDETARVAMQAAMTGHLVFSTVHSKDTIGAVFRLLDLGVEPYLVANSLDLVVAQRLVRMLCDHCKRPVRVTPGQATRMGRFLENKSEIYSATGCARCLRTGYRGRQAIFEMLEFNDDLRDVVLKEPTIQAMRRVIESGLFTTLMQSGWQLVARGVTTLDEVDRVAGGG